MTLMIVAAYAAAGGALAGLYFMLRASKPDLIEKARKTVAQWLDD